MDGRAFLDVARELVQRSTEAHWRSATGRAYYALFLEARDALERWGLRFPPRNSIHSAVRLRFDSPTNPDLRTIAEAVEMLGRRRNNADYRLQISTQFLGPQGAQNAITWAEQALALLDQIQTDPARLAAAVADIQARWP